MNSIDFILMDQMPFVKMAEDLSNMPVVCYYNN